MNNQLSTYATYMVIGEIKRFLRDNGPIKVSRTLKEIASKVKETKESYIKERGMELSIDEISKLLNIDKEDIVMALDASLSLESIDKKIGDEDSCTIGERIPDRNDDYEKIINVITINKAMDNLEEQEKKIIIYRFYRELTQKKIAELIRYFSSSSI